MGEIASPRHGKSLLIGVRRGEEVERTVCQGEEKVSLARLRAKHAKKPTTGQGDEFLDDARGWCCQSWQSDECVTVGSSLISNQVDWRTSADTDAKTCCLRNGKDG